MSSGLDFKQYLKLRRMQLIAQVVLVITFICALHFLASQHFAREDLTRMQRYSLSPETLAYVKRLDQPVKIIIAFSSEGNESVARIQEDIKRLVTEYQYAAKSNRLGNIKLQLVDVYKQRKQADELIHKYGVIHENIVIVASADRYREVPMTDMFVFEGSDIKAFKGESALTSAIIDVTDQQMKKAYFLSGHGEMSPSDVQGLRGISQGAELLRAQNYSVDTLDITDIGDVPSDVDVLIVASPQVPLLPYEVNKLKKYLNDNGRLILLLSPRRNHGMDTLLKDWGLASEDRVVIDVAADYQQTGGDFLIKQYSSHPISDPLIEYELGLLVGLMRPVSILEQNYSDTGLKVTSLMQSSESSWAKEIIEGEQDLFYDERYDIAGPISLGAIAERRVDSDLGLNISSGKLLVLGNADFVANHRLNALGNRMFFANAVHWMADKVNVASIPAKEVQQYQVVVSKNVLVGLALRILMVPLFILFAGFFVYYFRYKN